MKKCFKFLTGILIALLLVCTFSTNSAEAKKKAKTVSYSLRGSVLTIKGQGAIPSDMTFKNNKKIKRVIIKKSITAIPEDAFYGCKNLKSVKLPNGLKTIGPCAFYGTSIKTVTVPSSVKTIGTGAFDTKKLITRIKLPGKFSPKYVEKEEVNTSSAVVVSAKIIEFTTPIDSKVHIQASPMPGYPFDEVMAAGCFTEGSTIELSADAPVVEPYTLYMQGGLTYEYGKLSIMLALSKIQELMK